MKKLIGILTAIPFAALLAWAEPAVSAPLVPPAAQIAERNWQEDWDKTVAAAKKEGKLVFYSGAGPEVRTALAQAFLRKFGIEIEYVTGKGAELTQKIFAERRAGLYLSDLYNGGATTAVTQLKPSGVFAPLRPLLVLPEVLDGNAYFDGEIPFIDKENVYMICNGPSVTPHLAINSELVQPGEIKSYADLLNPKWKGKTAFFDPTVSGTGAGFMLATLSLAMVPDFHRQFSKQEPVITRDRRLQVEWVVRGKYPIALAPLRESVSAFQKAGSPIKWVVPQEGVFLIPSGSGSLSYFADAPHPNAAKVFINWFMTREGMTVYSKASMTQTPRKDVPTDFLSPESIRGPGVKYFGGWKEHILVKEKEAIKLAKEIYGPLVK